MRASQCIILLGLICAFSQAVFAVGTCQTDEICGFTDVNLSIPQFSSDHSLSTLLSVNRFHANSDDGFSLATVGGITFTGAEGFEMHTPGNIFFSAPVGGDIEFQGDTVTLGAGDLLSFWVANEAILDTKDDILMDIPFGTIDFESHFETRLSTVHSMVLSSRAGDIRLEAPEGTTTAHGDLVGVVAGGENGNGMSIMSSDRILLNAKREFDLLATNSVEFNATTEFKINSKISNIEFEAGSNMHIHANSNIVSSAADEIELESVLGSIFLDTNGALSLYARNIQQKASDISLTSENHFIIDGSGRANFISENDNVLTITNAGFMALENLQFIGTSNGKITFDVNSLTQTAADLHVQAADLAGSGIHFTAGPLSFGTQQSNIVAHTSDADFTSASTTFNMRDSFLLQSVNSHPYVPGTFQDDSGLINFLTGDDFDLTAAAGVVQLASDAMITLDDGNVIDFVAEAIAFSSMTRTHFDSFAIDFHATTDFSLTSFTDTTLYGNGGVILEGKLSSTIRGTDVDIDSDEFNLQGADISIISVSGDIFVSLRDLIMQAASDVRMNFDNTGTQEVIISSKETTTIQSETVLFDALALLTFEVPSGGVTFQANNEINFDIFEGTFTSITSSIQFLGGPAEITAQRAIFRAGNDFSFSGAGSLTVAAEDVSIVSATALGIISEDLSLTSATDIQFDADDYITFFSEGDFDLSPQTDGEIDLSSGRVIFQADGIYISGNHAATVTSDDYNSVEFHSLDDLDIIATGNLLFDGQYFIHKAENLDITASTNFEIVANDNINFVTRGTSLYQDETTVIDVDGAAAFTGTYFRAESFSKDGNWQLVGGNQFTTTNSDSITLDGEGTIDFDIANQISITGDSMYIQLIENNQHHSSDYFAGNTVDMLTTNDIRTETGKYTHAALELSLAQMGGPTGAFDIRMNAADTLFIDSLSQTYSADEDVNIDGGLVMFRASTDITHVSEVGITISSMNGDNRFADSYDDKIYAGNAVTLHSASRMNLVSVGFPNLPNTPDVLPGFEVDIHTGSLQFLAPTSTIEAYAPMDHIRISTNGNDNNIAIENTRDLMVNGGLGAISLDAYGVLSTDSYGVNFNAVAGDVSIDAVASVVFSSAENQITDTLLGGITFDAVNSIHHLSAEHDGVLLYNPLGDALDVTVSRNIMLTAGESLYNADITMTAAQNFEVLTKWEQRYLSVGPSIVEGRDAILLTGDEGPVRFTTPANQQIHSSGVAYFESQTDMLTVTAMDNIGLYSHSEIYFTSQFDLPIDVSAGSVTLAANGGGGSLDIISDDAQSITATASDSILFHSEDSTYVYSKTGLDFVTALGNIEFTQSGDDQNTHFHSEGSVVLQALAADGIIFTSTDFVGQAERDIFFDATDNFSIGANSEAFSATEPVIEFTAGDDGANSMVFDVLGGMSWTSALLGVTSFSGHSVSWTTGADVNMDTNGGVLFNNAGDDASLSMLTQGLLTLNGGEAVELTSGKALLVDAVEDISLTSTGVSSTDVSHITSRENLIVNADTYQTTTDVFTGYVFDFFVDVNGEIDITNTVGDGGSFYFGSDSTLKVSTSAGPMDFTSSGTTTIATNGPDSHIIFGTAGNQNIISGEAFVNEGSSIDIDAPAGIHMESLLGNVVFESSDYIEVVANGTMSLASGDVVTLESGKNIANGIQSHFNVSSRGDLWMTAQDDFTFAVTESNYNMHIISDKDLSISNSLPTRPSDQGDIIISSADNMYTFSGADAFIDAGRNVYAEADDMFVTSFDDMTYHSTQATSSTLLESADELNIDAYNELTLWAMTTATLDLTGSFTWDQINEEGFGGITVDSTGEGAPVAVTAESYDFNALAHVKAHSDAYMLFSIANNLDFSSTAHGADVTFSNKGTGGMHLVGNIYNFGTTSNDNSDTVIKAFGGAGDVSISMTATNSIEFDTDDSDMLIHSNTITFENPLTVGSDIIMTAGTMSIVGTGVNSQGNAISVESDDTITFDGDNLRMFSGRHVEVTASEDFTFDFRGDFLVSSGNDVLIATGFTPQPNAQINERIGILLEGTSRSNFQSVHHDIIVEAEDASFSVSNQMFIRSGSSVTFGTTADIDWNADTVTIAAEEVNISADVDFSSSSTFQIIARESVSIFSTDMFFNGNTIDIFADEEILFTTPFGYVHASQVQNFRIPVLKKEGGNSGSGLTNGDRYRTSEENQYPDCEERSFGFDVNTKSFCYCHWNKWRCVDPSGP